MSQDDPFSKLPSDRTLVMPSPGSRQGRQVTQFGSQLEQQPAAQATPPQQPQQSPGNAQMDPSVMASLSAGISLNPLVAEASSLMMAGPQLRTSHHPDPPGLRDALAVSIRQFEERVRAAGVPNEQVVAARYCLCTFLDEFCGSTPWGGSGVWARQSLLVMFHNEAWGGEKFFQLLARLAENPGANRNLLELMYVMLALGFEGRYKVIDNGKAQLDTVRERLHQMIRNQRGEYERDLSPHWQGTKVERNKVLAMLPVWVVAALAALIVVAAYMGFSFSLSNQSDPVFTRILGIRASSAVPPKPPAPAEKPRLATFLEPEIKAHLVTVSDLDDRSVITIRGDGFFEPGSATVAERVRPLLVRIADALNSVPGKVLITGHTDSQPIRTARFPSNWHLSQERALNVEKILAQQVDPARMRAEGMADSEPVATNETAEGRSQNRRVEITLMVARGEN
ncbi:MAG: DotU family type VI secretion system protein [Rhodocyclaceae bacterium]|nr:DotU family type VI secretion system protein [Rhodocyclaceae bacterium]